MSSSLYAIAIQRPPRDADDLRLDLTDIALGPIPFEDLKAVMLALVPEVRWSDQWNRAMGKFADGTEMEIVVLEANGTLSLRSSHSSGTALKILERLFALSDEWVLFDEEMNPWRPRL